MHIQFWDGWLTTKFIHIIRWGGLHQRCLIELGDPILKGNSYFPYLPKVCCNTCVLQDMKFNLHK